MTLHETPGPKPWSIGVYRGPSPFALAPAPGVKNPVLSRRDVTDVAARFVADPFLVRRGGAWHMFFEVMRADRGRGEIGLATSRDGRGWRYRRIVLAEPFHLSYPQVFRRHGAYFMVPESAKAGSLRLYRARRFPFEWCFVATLLHVPCVDATVFRHHGRWWILACTTPGRHETLALYGADRLDGPWGEHPASPLVVGDRRTARPAGPVVRLDGRLFRTAQDCTAVYGERVLAFEILELTPRTYREREREGNPVLEPAAGGWNGSAMHHLDPHPSGAGDWIAAVDGQSA